MDIQRWTIQVLMSTRELEGNWGSFWNLGEES